MNVKHRIKKGLISIYEKVYVSDFVLNRIYHCENRNYKLNIMNDKKTLKYILETECSISRFGEGEFELILNPNLDLGFQRRNEKLSEALRNVLRSKNKDLKLCIPYALNDIGGRTEHSRKFWYNWGKTEEQHHRIISLIKQLNSSDYQFGDTQITRPYIAYKEKAHGDEIFPILKTIWDDKDILFVEGEKTRMGVGNDLFANANSIKRILCPAINAFDYYREIANTVKNYWNGELILLALGPTATVLAADFADSGMRSLDLGHVDIEYEWYMRGAKEHETIIGKYTNEAIDGNTFVEQENKEYERQIIAKVGC